MQDYEKARLALAELIRTTGATMESVRLLARPDGPPSAWDKNALHFQCVIKAPHLKAPITVHWSCGSAIPGSDAQRTPKPAWFRRLHHGAALRDYLAAPRSVDGARGAKILREAYRPDMVDVLQSCLMDSSEEGRAFEEWCSDLGYDTDSRRAYATWEACQRTARDMRAVPRRLRPRAARCTGVLTCQTIPER